MLRAMHVFIQHCLFGVRERDGSHRFSRLVVVTIGPLNHSLLLCVRLVEDGFAIDLFAVRVLFEECYSVGHLAFCSRTHHESPLALAPCSSRILSKVLRLGAFIISRSRVELSHVRGEFDRAHLVA